MKKQSPIHLTTLLLVALLAVGTRVWAAKFALTASSKVPSASGEVNTDTDPNGNTKVDVKVQNLARPGNLTPPATAYTVWFEQEGSGPLNEGELRVGKDLKGELKATTPWKNFDVFITAESDPHIKTPSGDRILSTKVQTS
jgi:hypothetical protein